MGILSNLLGGGIKALTDSAGSIIDKFVESPEERNKAKAALMEAQFKFKEQAFEAEKELYKDRASARELGKTDPWTPRILTILFTAGYFAITAFMFSIVFEMFNQDMNDFVVSFISTIFGAFNAIMVQIISYYFGASKGGDDQGSKIADSFNQSMSKKKEDLKI